MGDIGTITEIEPEDGLGWIELPNGDRVRFGGTSCKGFVPAIGMAVEILGTRPAYGGGLKATELRKVDGAAAAAAPAAPAAAAAAPQPRTALHEFQASGVRGDDLLLKVLAQDDVDDRLHGDLEAIAFAVRPIPGLQLGCKNPFFYAVAVSGKEAIGLYVHPVFDDQPAYPWVLWSESAGTLRHLADDTASLFPTLLATASAAGVANDTVARLRSDLSKMGMPDAEGAPHGGGAPAAWLPPDDADLRSVDDYLTEEDGTEMERGLLAHTFRHGDERAAETLRSIYEAWEWSLPKWAG